MRVQRATIGDEVYRVKSFSSLACIICQLTLSYTLKDTIYRLIKNGIFNWRWAVLLFHCIAYPLQLKLAKNWYTCYNIADKFRQLFEKSARFHYGVSQMLSKFREKLRKIPKPAVICSGAVAAALLIGFGVYLIWHTFAPTVIKGIDVSHYQGDISWRAIEESGNVKFVYLKATEGSTFQDPDFSKNWRGATDNGISAGAYHFYTQSSTGYDQALNFIATVPKEKGKLPPAIDIEGSVTKQENFKAQLATYVKTVTKHYNQKPVFYVPYQVYNLLYDDYKGYTFWIINVDSKPVVKGWTFWQYSSKGFVAGIDGKVDLDQYKGSRWNYRSLLSK